MDHATEMQLVRESQHDPEAFGKLYDRYYGAIFGFFFRRVGEADLAKDLTSETFFSALKARHTFTDRGRSFGAWLFAIANNQAMTYFRKRKQQFPVVLEAIPDLLEDDQLNPLEALMQDEQEKAHLAQLGRVRQLMQELPDALQSVLSLRFFAQQTVPEIAQTLDLKEGTVKSLLHRTLRRLRTVLTQTESVPEMKPLAHSLRTTTSDPSYVSS